jgi:hypothetical protein
MSAAAAAFNQAARRIIALAVAIFALDQFTKWPCCARSHKGAVLVSYQLKFILFLGVNT